MNEPLAIIDIGDRGTGGIYCPRSFWEALCEGRDAITEVSLAGVTCDYSSIGTKAKKERSMSVGSNITAPECVWRTPPENPSIPEGHVHVWRSRLAMSPQRILSLAQTLSTDEQQKADRFQCERDRNWFIARHGLLRDVLSRYLHVQPDKLVFSFGPQGKPQLASPAGHNMCFSMSPSNGLALYAIKRSRTVGIDVEYIRPMPNATLIAKNYFFSGEQALMNSLPRDLSERVFFHLWTAKEAYCKATGEGVAGLGHIEVALADTGRLALRSIRGDNNEAGRWSMCQLTPEPAYTATLVTKGHNRRVGCFGL